jgi:hypothetical protein
LDSIRRDVERNKKSIEILNDDDINNIKAQINGLGKSLEQVINYIKNQPLS